MNECINQFRMVTAVCAKRLFHYFSFHIFRLPQFTLNDTHQRHRSTQHRKTEPTLRVSAAHPCKSNARARTRDAIYRFVLADTV